MIQLVRLLWYINMLILAFYILKQQPKLTGMNNISKREKGFSLSSNKEKLLLQQTWILLISFTVLTIGVTKFTN
uniref:preprotein translocase subunit G n=1 Tax=Tsunamia transpacifica TaxID=1935457 RepID=UPI001BF058B2|nr:preprotein translocase subunit G [Tsunamia transpacifica]QUE27919.1 SecG [Tsunamia transpacifica]UNJ14435.1 preprotein translocase subunit G [Tsunamia transpacifica]